MATTQPGKSSESQRHFQRLLPPGLEFRERPGCGAGILRSAAVFPPACVLAAGGEVGGGETDRSQELQCFSNFSHQLDFVT